MILILTSRETVKPKTEEFLRLLGKNLSLNGSDFSVSSFRDIEVFISNGHTDISVSGKPLRTWSTIFPRKVGPYSGLAFILASSSERLGITFIDRFRKSTNDITKLVQMFLFSSENIPIPKTYHSASYHGNHISNAIRFLGFPIVVKQCNTSKGSGVALAKNRGELESKIRDFLDSDPKKEVVLQEFIGNGFEYRIFVTGTAVAVAEKKTRTSDEEFRNNVHLGAVEEFIDPKTLGKSLLDTALRAAKTTDIQVAGVDIVENGSGHPVVFEVNSCPGFTLDENVSDEIRQLSLYLTSCEKR